MKSRIFFYFLIHFSLANIDGNQIQPTHVSNNLVTQTVYGFLDFTTTIGNTVMIFSPQSSSVNVEPKISSTVSVQKEVIENKPIETIKKSISIQPSKTQKSVETKSSYIEKKVDTTTQNASGNKSNKKIISKVNIIESSSIVNVLPSSIVSSQVKVVEAASTKLPTNNIISSKIEVVSGPSYTSKVDIITTSENDDSDSSIMFGNNVGEPEYEFLSRQPSEVIEETYKVINFKTPSSKFLLKPAHAASSKNKATKKINSLHPTGLVTKLGGTVVKNGVTTVHETSVIGTHISGKYAQVLQSTTHVLNSAPKERINPSPTLRILKTAAPIFKKSSKNRNIETTAAASVNEETTIDFPTQNNLKTTKKNGAQPFKLRYKNKSNENNERHHDNKDSQSTSKKKSSRNRSHSRNSKENTTHRSHKSRRGNRKKINSTTPSYVHSDDDESTSFSATTKRYRSNGRKNKAANRQENSNNSGEFTRKFKPKIQASAIDSTSSTSLYKFKLNRSPGRWQYKTTPKPRVTIRKNNNANEAIPLKNETTNTISIVTLSNANSTSEELQPPKLQQQDDSDGLEESESMVLDVGDDASIENKLDTPAFPLETIKVEISTPPDFKDIYYEIATIKSPYTFQVGSVKNTRFITVTSTFEKSLTESQEPTTISPTQSMPLTENILTTSSNYDKNNFLDESIATLPPIYVASNMETPPLETTIETFSTTETMLKTHILPIVHNRNDTSTSTLIQTYMITRLVTATKTLPPMDAYHFIPSKTLNEFNSHLDEAGSELHLELEFGDQNEQDPEVLSKFYPEDELSIIGSKFNVADVDKNDSKLRLKKANSPTNKNQLIPEPAPTPSLSPEQLQQLAFLRLLNPVITTSKPVFKVETLYESHVIPITNGPYTFSTTLSKIVGTITKTDYEFGTSTLAHALPPPLGFPQPPVNPLLPQVPQVPQVQPQFSITSSPVVQTTIVTQTTSKVLKLTFGAKTAYTTVLSSTVVPTVLTTYVTSSVPVQPTAAYPGFFPAPYPPYPYVG